MRRLRIIGAILALVLLLGGIAVLVLTNRDRARISGTVTLPSGGPAVGYTVVAELHPKGGAGEVRGFPLLRPLSWETTTDRSGHYELRGVRTDGEVWVAVAIPGLGFAAWGTAKDLHAGESRHFDIVVPKVTVTPPRRTRN